MSPPAAKLVPRVLAPLAVLAAAVAVIAVLDASLGAEEDGRRADRQAERQSQARERQGKRREEYVVQEGDTISAISAKTGVPEENILQLNPDVDPRALSPGVRLKLR